MILMILYVSNKSLLKLGLIISIVVVVIVALSRLVVAAHFPTDVITSAIMYPILVMYNLDFFKNSSFINRKILKR
ncbi:PAP2 superfamily [Chlamydia trachomatis]|nr:PAP2 superfamily [Chlamydia trachomatis]